MSDDAPLFAWGDALRAAKLRRRMLVRRSAAVAIVSATVLAPIAVPPAPRLVWNSSESAPIGLYAVSVGKIPDTGDMVVARLPKVIRRLAAERRYLPDNVPLVKRVAAVAGDEICATGNLVIVNGKPVAHRRAVDKRARRLPFWLGCRRLHGRQVLLLMDNPLSFDGRYFGPIEGTEVIGKARLLWAR
jgi:conjugative transfer signal peptidase TraF